MDNNAIAQKWHVEPGQLQNVWNAIEAKHPVFGRIAVLFIQKSMEEADPAQVDVHQVTEVEKTDAATLVIDPIILAIIFGCLSLVATVIAPELCPLVQQVVGVLNTVLPIPLPMIPCK